ncbi:MAG: thiamine pyrophosphate-binding protein [Candidatus Eisenbacteria bacterium]
MATGMTLGATHSVVVAAEGGLATARAADTGAPMHDGTGADLLLEQVKAAGTRFVFANPGSIEVAFYDAMTDRPELQLIMGLHEGVVISMADGYHKVSERPAFVNVHAVAGTGQIGGQMFSRTARMKIPAEHWAGLATRNPRDKKDFTQSRSGRCRMRPIKRRQIGNLGLNLQSYCETRNPSERFAPQVRRVEDSPRPAPARGYDAQDTDQLKRTSGLIVPGGTEMYRGEWKWRS